MGLFDLVSKKPTEAQLSQKSEGGALTVRGAMQTAEVVPTKSRTKAAQRMGFITEVVQYARDMHVSEQDACMSVAMLKQDRYDLISLTYPNFRVWVGKTGRGSDGLPNARNINALLDSYTSTYVRKGNDTFWMVVMQMVLNDEKMPIKKAYDYAVRVCQIHGITDIPTCFQTKHYLKHKFPDAARLFARKGEKWGEDRLASYVHRDWSSVRVGEVWFGDHHVLDCYVKVWDDDAQKWRVTRPWLTMWLDARSLYPVGVVVGINTNNSLGIIKALAMGYCASGGQGPEILYVDNGKDFLRLGLGTPIVSEDRGKEYAHSILLELGCKMTTALPYHGRTKTVERIFKEVADGYCRTVPTYLGNNPQQRPETASYYDAHPEDAPSLEAVQDGLFDYLYNVYAKKPQNSKILGGHGNVCPAQKWSERPCVGRVWENLADLRVAMRLPDRTLRKVGQGFNVRIAGKDYRAIKANEQALYPYYNRTVLIKQDTFDGTLYAYDLQGRFITELEEVPGVKAVLAAYDDEERKKLSDEIARGKRELKWARGVIADATGLPVMVSVQEAIALMEPGAKLKLLGTKMSVKGSTHLYKAYKVEIPGQEVTELPRLETEKIEVEESEQKTEQNLDAGVVKNACDLIKNLRAKRADITKE